MARRDKFAPTGMCLTVLRAMLNGRDLKKHDKGRIGYIGSTIVVDSTSMAELMSKCWIAPRERDADGFWHYTTTKRGRQAMELAPAILNDDVVKHLVRSA